MTIRVEVQGNFADLVPKARRRAGLVVRKVAKDARVMAQQLAPVDTGHLKGSISDEPVAELTAEVNVGAEYGHYVEYGTGRGPAQPYITPAVAAQVEPFERAMQQLLES